MARLAVEGVHKRLGATEVLRGVSFVMEPGEIVALLGPSGSGKTTLLRQLAGLDHPDRGRIVVGDEILFDAAARIAVPAEERRIGLVFQSYALWPHRTVFDNVAYGLRLRGVRGPEIRARVDEVLGQLGLGGLAGRWPHELSGGQQQRVAIARAIAPNPAVVLADEPTANLDSDTADRLLVLMEQLNRDRGVTFIFATHDPRVMAHARRVVRVVDGRVESDELRAKREEEP